MHSAQVLTDAQADIHFLTSKSPTSKDQISSLLSTFQTLIKPLMSAVATKEESLLNIAQVTESLWPVNNKKERKKNQSSHRFGKPFPATSYRRLRENEIVKISITIRG